MLHKGCEGGITGKSAIKTTVPPQLPGVEGVDLPIDPHIAALPSISFELVNGGEFRASRCIAGPHQLPAGLAAHLQDRRGRSWGEEGE